MVMMDSSRAHFDAFLALYHLMEFDDDKESLSFHRWTCTDKVAFFKALVRKLTTDPEFREDFIAFDGRGQIAYKPIETEDPRKKLRPDLDRLDEMHIYRRGV